MLPWLDKIKVSCQTRCESRLTIKLQHRIDQEIASGVWVGTRSIVGEIGETIHWVAIHQGADIGGQLRDPNQFFTRVIEGQLLRNIRGCKVLRSGELQLCDEVLVGDLSELTSFISIQKYIIDPEACGRQ